MTKPLTIVIYGKPKQQDRPRATVIKGHAVVYDTKVSKDGKREIADATEIAVQEQKWEKANPGEALSIVVTAYIEIPKSFTKKQKEDALAGRLRPTSKPDTDNIAKIYMDGVVYGGAMHDDALIVEQHCSKWYSLEPRTVINIDRIGNGNG